MQENIWKSLADREREARRLESELAEVCGILHATTGRMIELVAKVLATGAWEGVGIRSPEHWVAWKCGVSPGRARRLVAMARRLGDLPETRAALEAGEVSEDQAAVVCRHVPPTSDAEAAQLARNATVSQLRRVLGSYVWEEEAAAKAAPPPEPGPAAEPAPEPPPEPRRVSFGYTDEGSWRLSAELASDEGALWERALSQARISVGEPSSWPDAFVAVAERSLHGRRPRPDRDRTTVLLHVEAEGPRGHLHLGPGVPAGLRRFLSCDARVRIVREKDGKPLSVGRSTRTVPDATRIAVEERDRGCRVPGCPRTKWLHVHHVVHWEDGGTTDLANLAALCSTHHRLHHRGGLRIEGDASRPDGLLFTDHHGRLLTPAARPRPPGDDSAAPTGHWVPPTGERLDGRWVVLVPPAAAGPAGPRVAASEAAGAPARSFTSAANDTS